MVTICRYSADNKQEWDAFVATSKNATFLHFRDYMDYHADRFCDHSLMAYDDEGELIALLPANVSGETLYSHQGLTYGGWLTQARHLTGVTMLEIFDAMTTYLRENGIRKLVYKAIPYIYHKYPADEDIYALFRHGARLATVNLSSVAIAGDPSAVINRGARSSVNHAKRQNIIIEKSQNFAAFWKILSDNLRERYNTTPVHSLEEITLLASRFPDNIHLFLASQDSEILGGSVIYQMNHIVHAQYFASTTEGNKKRVMSYIYYHLIYERFADKKYFDLGTSNERNGWILNNTLLDMKARFGARGVAFNIYELDI